MKFDDVSVRRMSWLRVLACALCVVASATSRAAPETGAPPAPPPVEAFGQVPAVTDVDINPAGTRLAWIDNSGKLARIVIYDLERRGEVRSLHLPAETTPREVLWADNKTILISVTVTHSEHGWKRERREWQRWYSLDLFADSPRMLLTRMGMLERNYGAGMIRRHTSKPGKVFMSGWGDYHVGESYLSGTYNLYEVDLESGDGRVLEKGTAFTDEWAVDPSGKFAVRSDLEPVKDKFSIQVRDDKGWRRIYESKQCGRLRGTYLAPDNAAVIAVGKTCDDPRVKLWSLPLDGSPMKALVEDPALDVEDVVVDPASETIVAATLAGSGRPRRWLDPQTEQRHAALHRSFGADWISVTGQSTDNQRVVVRVEGASRPPVFHLVDYEAKRADVINEAYPGLSAARLGNVSEFKYESRDMYPLTARLTLPHESAGKNLPLVVLPHDGPEDRDAEVFDWEAQFLASRGYAVLQPQFRGSTGFGQAHADAGRRQWGLRMQDDVTDAVRAVIAQGIADPKRTCIAGHGYGGYVALAGVAFTPKQYACAASIGGISDLPFMVGHINRLTSSDYSPMRTYWRDHIGSVSNAHIAVYSPARSAANVIAPVLLIHGTEDTVVPIAQSRIMARALKKAGKRFELVELPDEDHWLSQSATRIRMLTELERFLAMNLAATGSSN